MGEAVKIDLEFDLGQNGGKCHFHTLEEFEAWLQKEQEFWSWLGIAASREGLLDQVWRVHSSVWSSFQQLLPTIRQLVGNDRQSQFIATLRSRVVDAYQVAPHHPIHSGSVIAKHIDCIKGTDPLAAGFALGAYMGFPDGNSVKWMRGVFTAMAQERGILDSAVAEKAQLLTLQQAWQVFTDTSAKQFDSVAQKFSSFAKGAEEQAVAQKVAFDKAIAESNGALVKSLADSKLALDSSLKAAQGRLDTIQKTYDEKMALQASVTYWKVKAKSHLKLAKWFSVGVLLAFLAVGYSLYKTLALVGGKAKINELELWKVGLVAIVAVVGVWLIRVLVRLLLSNVHLYTDSSERRTMMLTYLALMHKKQLPNANERELILQALFRPSSTGIVKDDGAPPFMAEWLKRTTGTD